MTSPQRGSSVDRLHSIRTRIIFGCVLVLLLLSLLSLVAARSGAPVARSAAP